MRTQQQDGHPTRRSGSDEHYIIDLCDEILNRKACRQYRFEFLLGDPGNNGRCAKLPVDAYYEDLNLVIEYMESQHTIETPFFDKTHKMTVSGVHRGEQRKRYDQRRDTILHEHRIKLVGLETSMFPNNGRKLRRIPEDDKRVIRNKLAQFLTPAV